MNPLTITILIIFATTLIGTILQRRAKDPCLKKFHGYRVFVRMKSGRWIWGELRVYSKSLEIVYGAPDPSKGGHEKLSYLIFEDKLPEIHLILRPIPKEGTEAHRRWQLDFRRVISHTVWFNFRRGCRNLWNTLRDAFSQSLGLVVGQFRARNPAALLNAADQKVTHTGQLLISLGNNAYEPILEKYLGREVIAEFLNGDHWIEKQGGLEEYSDKYILLRKVAWGDTMAVPSEFKNLESVDIAFPRAHSVVRHLAGVAYEGGKPSS